MGAAAQPSPTWHGTGEDLGEQFVGQRPPGPNLLDRLPSPRLWDTSAANRPIVSLTIKRLVLRSIATVLRRLLSPPHNSAADQPEKKVRRICCDQSRQLGRSERVSWSFFVAEVCPQPGLSRISGKCRSRLYNIHNLYYVGGLLNSKQQIDSGPSSKVLVMPGFSYRAHPPYPFRVR